MKTIEERIAVLKVQRDGIAAAMTYEDFKVQQLSFVDFLIEDLELDKAQDDHTFNWIVKTDISK